MHVLRHALLLILLSFGINTLLAETIHRPVGHMIYLSDFGSEDLAYLSIPTTSTPPTLGIVLVPDAFGLDNYTLRAADRLADMGFMVVAVDLYTGRKVTDQTQAESTAANMSAPLAIKTITAGIRLFKESNRYQMPHVAALGWGTGAKYLYETAHDNKTLEGIAMFYGPIETNLEHLPKMSADVCAVYSMHDPNTPHDGVLAFQKAMRGMGNNFEAWFLDAGYGWSHPLSPNYNPSEDNEAWKVALPFFQRIALAPPRPEPKPSMLDKVGDLFK